MFYYFNGTINYTNSVLSKILNITDDDAVVDAANAVLSNWLQSIKNMRDVIYYDELGPDGSSTFGGKRRSLSLTHYNEKMVPKLLYITGIFSSLTIHFYLLFLVKDLTKH